MNLTLPNNPITDYLTGQISTEEMLKRLIGEDQDSKNKEEMVKSINYYNGNNDIILRRFNTVWVEDVEIVDHHKSNEHMINGMHTFLVDQKVGYIAGKPVIFKIEKLDLEAIVKVEINEEEFADIMADYIEGASIKGYEILYPYVDFNDDFKYIVIPGEETIIIKDTQFQKNIIQMVRYYTMDVIENGKRIDSIRVELYDDEKVTFYQENELKEFEFIQPNTLGVSLNPSYYMYNWDGEPNKNIVTVLQENFDGVSEIDVRMHGWKTGVPIIQLLNNTRMSTDLRPIKSFIDALDIVTSGFINDLADIQQIIWVLRGLGGEDLATFRKRLIDFKAILLEGDEDEASVDTKSIEIPIAARGALITYCERQIFKLGGGVNLESLATSGITTNVGIKIHFTPMDTKANKLIIKLKASLKLFTEFLIEFINRKYNKSYVSSDIKVIINKSMIFNDKELIEEINLSGNDISRKTRLELNPLIDDVKVEEERLEEEQANNPLDIDFNDEDDENNEDDE